ncbi:UNVERIFIED_CONTAM: Methyl-CpG-binding domain-containing protein 9 [Sesamum radiatum]|uniref:Methyl-CpG-binding domain-containing protein 9 n=1 Tax=Sesamum radiatum TaxID=300843 RepID=A0AAW2RC32_SESRA
MEAQRKDESQINDDLGRKQHLLLGKPISSELTPFLGDILRSWNFLWRFREVLGLSKDFSFEKLTAELNGSLFDGLSETHILMLQVLISDFPMKFENGSKRNVECLAMAKRTEMNVPPLNDLTWPELARRYVLAVLFMIADSESVEVREDMDMFRCLHGDGGPRCGALTGVVGLEADAWSWNFLWRFREVLGLSKGFSFEELTAELNGSLFDGLSETHILMLQVLISDFPMQFENGSKRDVACSAMAKRTEMNVPALNDLTWPELARRYVLAALFMIANSELVEVREDMDMLRCLHGDGGPRCGALTGVVGLEADAWLLAEAINKIYGSLYDDNERLATDDLDSDKETMSRIVVNEEVPGWVRELEPIKNLKTNVGSKIRNCINNSLAKEPPEWARKVLDNSISKEVYKANASGPTKKLALSVVAQFRSMQQNLAITRNKKDLFAISNIVMKQCRFVLHQAALAKETKEFCALIQERFVKHGNCEEGILGSPAIISSLLNFRMIDMRLAAGAYCGSHEAFAEEVQEVGTSNVYFLFARKFGIYFICLLRGLSLFWRNVLIDFENDSQLVDSAKKSCRVFESLYDKEVVALYQKLINDHRPECFNDAVNKDLGYIAVPTREISKGSWGEGFCKVCGIDENNKKVLLCDTCDAEYHTYCLRPPLTKVPKGNWFCSFCGSKDMGQDSHLSPTSCVHEQEKKPKRDIVNFIRGEIFNLTVAMTHKDYWELSFYEKTSLLKFICDEILGTTLVREHLLNCESPSNLHKSSTSVELQALGDKEDIHETGIGLSKSPGISEDAPSAHISENAPASSNVKLISVGLGTKTLKSSLRSKFLGIDSGGKLCWRIDSGTSPWILVNEVDEPHRNGVTSQDFELLSEIFTLSGKAYSSWASYQSDVEIKRLMDSLKDDELIRRQLGDTFAQRREVSKYSERQSQEELHPSLLERGKTRATKLLELKYGPFVKLETTDFPMKHNKGKSVAQEKMYRCDCLELILPTDYHCLSCHRTCFSIMEFQLHGNGKCYLKKRESIISLHGEGTSKSVDGHDFSIGKKITTCSTDGAIASNTLNDSEIEVEAQVLGHPGGLQHVDKVSQTHNVTQELEIEKLCEAPESSKRPLIGRALGVLTQLKINLLDMEAAVPKVAFRSSKGCVERRRVWRMFVKCASNIYEMVQAVIVFEDMIKLEYIAPSWRKYWSFSAAAKISTLAALALRIYSLDAAINYDKTTSTSNALELLRKADKGRRQQIPSPVGRPSKKQKETQK